MIGRNEGERLRRCLQSIPPEIPVVYVDSSSTDQSVQIARRLGAQVVELDMARPFTAARARNEGVQRLGDWLPNVAFVQFIDGDCELEEGWLIASSVFLTDHPRYAVVCGRRRERCPDHSIFNKLCDDEWDTPVGDASSCGGDALMRYGVLRDVGGFDPAMIAGEEPELCARLRSAGWRIMRLDAPMTIHDAAMTRLSQWWFRALRSGFGYAQAWHRTRKRGINGTLYRRELARAIFWAGGLPILSILLALLVHPLLLFTWLLMVVIQYFRMAFRTGYMPAALSVIGKYAELAGAVRYLGRVLRGTTGGTIVYK